MSDHVYTLIPTRALRQVIATTVTNAMVIAPTPSNTTQGDYFQILDQDGSFLLNHTLASQNCADSSKRTLIRTNNLNDMLFGYLCQSKDLKKATLGLYQFNTADDSETKMKRIALQELWVVDLAEKGIKEPIASAIITRSMSSKLKFVIATSNQLSIVSQKDGRIES